MIPSVDELLLKRKKIQEENPLHIMNFAISH